ncbi:hypothetical protein JYT72_00065 [Crocinitomix catalasitica]|nr:hypothetical protein [Crocinitomix catalasitica]
MKRVCYFFLLGSVVLCSCKSDKLKDDKSVLTGKWNWIYSSYSSGWCNYLPIYNTLTPITEGKNYSVEFDQKGKIRFYEDGILTEEARIVFDYFEIDSEQTSLFYFYLNNDVNRGMEGNIHNDTLHFDYPLTPSNPDCESYLNFLVKE